MILSAWSDLLGVRRAADVEEVRGLAAVVLDQVHRRHREAGAVDHAADVAVELDVREALLACQSSLGGLVVRVASAPSRRAGSRRCRRGRSWRRARSPCPPA